METNASTRRYSHFLRERAAELDVKLPPIGKTAKRWVPSLRAPSGEPPELATTPGRFLLKLMALGWRPIALQTILMTISSVAGALIPATMGSMINGLINDGFNLATTKQLGLFLGLVLLIAFVEAVGELSGIATWFRGGLIGAWVVGRKVGRAGRAAKQDEPAGDVVTALVNDSDHIGMAFLWLPEAISAVISSVVIIVIMFSVSPPLGWLVVIGVPLSVALVSALARPIQKKLAVQREQQGKLTTVSTDAVSGLRILRGIGGEDAYNAKYQEQSQKVMKAGIAASPLQAWLMVLRSSIPQLLIALVIGYGAYLTFNGNIGVGDLVAFFGYTWYMRIPIGTAAGVVSTWTRAWVGAKKMAAIYSVTPNTSDENVDQSLPIPEWENVSLMDPESGATIVPGQLTGIVCAVPEKSADLAARLARSTDETDLTVNADGVDVRKYPLEEVRRGIFLSEANAQVFRESLQNAVMGPDATPIPTRGVTELIYREHIENIASKENMLFQPEDVVDSKRLRDAMFVADAADVESSLASGLAGELSEKGRNISGGQRQRVALARAVYSEAPILILVEPTSAVDSHTEARIAERLKAHRLGKTTAVVTTSPLFLSSCDQIIVLDGDGHASTTGSHESLMAAAKNGEKGGLLYRNIVAREMNE